MQEEGDDEDEGENTVKSPQDGSSQAGVAPSGKPGEAEPKSDLPDHNAPDGDLAQPIEQVGESTMTETISEEPGCAECDAPQHEEEFVYAIGRLRPQFPNAALQNEFLQVAGSMDTSGKTDQEVFAEIIGMKEYRYLLRQLCWVLTIQGMDAYTVWPRDAVDLDRILDCVDPKNDSDRMDIVVGVQTAIPPLDPCAGLGLPLILFENLYSFNLSELAQSIPKPKTLEDKDFEPIAREIVSRVRQASDNVGVDASHRAINYLIVRQPSVYATVAEAFGREETLTNIYVRQSRLSADRNIQDVVFVFTDRKTDVVTRYFIRVDVTGMYPFVVTKMSPYYVYDTNP